MPCLDRDPWSGVSRVDKLKLERTSIDVFRSTARFFAHRGEEVALADDFTTLAVLRHYGTPTRLLDWSISPYVAAFFAVCEDDEEDGRIWTFDEMLYEEAGRAQWRKWPETTLDGNGDPGLFRAGLTAFRSDEPPDWVVCLFYPTGFPRQDAQHGAYSVTARFARDHAEAIAHLLADSSAHHLYVVSADIKHSLKATLRERYGIWQGSLFPDSAGAAQTVKRLLWQPRP